jgi:predicted metalloprotease
MDWTPGETSGDIEDRRDDSGGGGGGGFQPGGIHFGIGGTLILLVLSFVFKTNLFSLFSNATPEVGPAVTHSVPDTRRDAQEEPEVKFVSFVLDDVQKTWTTLLPEQAHVPYHHAKLVLFRDSYPSACGSADAGTGPFYCPGDEKVYIDLSFFDELKSRFGASGQFAQAYVLAHEIGHHVQKLQGIESQMRRQQQRNPREANSLSVKLELQADCYAGIWGHTGEQRNFVHPSDVEDGLRAAAAVGDDHLQKMATGHVSPESFTHGSSAQRTEWFKRGLSEGRLSACDTFAER